LYSTTTRRQSIEVLGSHTSKR